MIRLVSLWILLALVTPWVVGCKFGRPDNLQLATESFYTSDLPKAEEYLLKEIEGKREGHDDQNVLNLASIYAFQGDFRRSESLFGEVRKRQTIQQNDVKNLAEQGIALFSDQRAVSYHWRQYEQLFGVSLMALCSQASDQVDVYAYAHQIEHFCSSLLAENQKGTIGSNAKPVSNQSQRTVASQPDELAAFGYFLVGLLRSQDPLQMEVAERNFRQAASVWPANPFFQAFSKQSEQGLESQGTGTITVISLLNPGPVYKEEVAKVSSAALLIATELISHKDDVSLPPTVAPVTIGVPAAPRQPIQGIQVSSGRETSESQRIWSVFRSATEEFERKKNSIVAKAVAARVLKKAVVHQGKDELGIGKDSGWSKALDLAGSLWEMTQRPDLRCWNFMPGEVHFNRLRLPAGTHHLKLKTILVHSTSGKTIEVPIQVRPGQDQVLILFCQSETSEIQVFSGK